MASKGAVQTNGITMAYWEAGPVDGPPVVLCHGFPGLGYSWRHQLEALGQAGYRVIGPDMRGYGDTTAPTDADDYTLAQTSADLAGLLDALHIERAVFGGHDFGAPLVWALPFVLPERVRALAQFSVPRMPRPPIPPSQMYAGLAEKHWVHFDYFKTPGVAEAELNPRAAEFLQGVFYALSGGYRYLDVWQHPATAADGSVNGYLDVLPDPPALPWPWLSQAEFDVYAETFTRTGFTGGLNWYRAADHVWRETADFADSTIDLPVLFIAGDRDAVVEMMPGGIDAMQPKMTDVRGAHLLAGAGHFVQMEAADDCNRLLLDFLGGLS